MNFTPLVKALDGDQLHKHSDIHLKLEVAYCIWKLTRKTAPDILYNFTDKKNVLKLIVCTFKLLSYWMRHRRNLNY